MPHGGFPASFLMDRRRLSTGPYRQPKLECKRIDDRAAQQGIPVDRLVYPRSKLRSIDASKVSEDRSA
jgi:hypothetical protein